ncbi:hypothetical protein Tco_0138033, partial [Tanacetum coccineum]
MKEGYDIWAYGKGITLRYIDNDVWKVFRWKPKKRILTGKEEHMRRFMEWMMKKRSRKPSELGLPIIKFLRVVAPQHVQYRMTMRTKPAVDTLSIDDLYNNLRVFEQEIQGASKTSLSAQNVAFVSQSKSNTNKVKSGFTGAYKDGTRFMRSGTMMDLDMRAGHKWLIAMIQRGHMMERRRETHFINIKKAGQVRGRNQVSLLIMDDRIVNWGEHTEVEEINHALMAISSSNEVIKIAQILPIVKLLKRYRRIGMKAVKEKEQLQKTLDSWKDSSKNLWRLINSGMSSNNKLGLGYEIQSNNEVLSVPHPLSGDYTPTPQEEIDESLYVYGKKGPQEPEPNVSDDRSSEYSTCQSNDSAGSIGTSSEHSVDPESEISSVPPEVYVSTPVTTNEKGVSDPKTKEIEPSCVSHIKTPRQPIKDQATPKVNRKNWNAMMERELREGYSFTKKKCFVCGSLRHLIKDCDYYKKKMAREAEFKKQRVFNTGNGVSKPVWTNANRVNHANQFVPRSVQVNTGRTNINSVRPNINTGRTNVNPVRPRVNTGSSNVNSVRSRKPVPTETSNSFSPKRPQ